MSSFLQDLRYGWRTLTNHPGFAAVAVVTLALGIGANTAIFSVINSVLLRPLPFRDPGQLVRIFTTRGAEKFYAVNGEDYFDWQAQNRAFQSMTLFSGPQNYNASGAGEPETVSVCRTQANFFSLLGVPPLYGRQFVQGEDSPGAARIAVLSYGFWQRHFGGNQDAIGKSIELNFLKYTVVGVMPRTFNYPEAIDAWVPLEMTVANLGHRGGYSYRVLARMRPSIRVEQAQADMDGLAKRLEKLYPITNSDLGMNLIPFKDLLTRDSRGQLLVLLGAVGLVLLVACANVANLLLARATERQREIALRSALGASRSRIVRQMLTESLVLSLAGAALGLAGAWWLVAFAQSAKALPLPRQNPIELDAAVLLFTIGVCLLVSILFGLLPALAASRANLNDELKSSGGSIVGRSGWRGSLRSALVVGEIALSLALLAGGGLLLRSFAEMRNANIGVKSENIVTMAVVVPNTKYATLGERRTFYDRLFDQVRHAPGVAAAALSQQIPLEGSHTYGAKLEGDLDPGRPWLQVQVNFITPGYFGVYGIPFFSGRDFTPQEIERAAQAGERNTKYWESGHASTTPQPQFATYAVINRRMAETLWPNQDAVGKVFISGIQPVTVVGVVGNVKYEAIREPEQPEAYFPITEELDNMWYPPEISVRTAGSPEGVITAVRSALQAVDGGLSLFRVRTMHQVLADNMQDTSLQTALLGSFAALGVILAAVGVYGVMAYLVMQRQREIGIRMALGARPEAVLHLVIGHGAKLAGLGVAVGIAAALALTRLLSTELFGVSANDPVTFAAVAAFLAAIALVACYIPARRAARVDPLVALRYE
jgi:putative ABC transport system permease protein